jgi:hypothetical protein
MLSAAAAAVNSLVFAQVSREGAVAADSSSGKN